MPPQASSSTSLPHTRSFSRLLQVYSSAITISSDGASSIFKPFTRSHRSRHTTTTMALVCEGSSHTSCLLRRTFMASCPSWASRRLWASSVSVCVFPKPLPYVRARSLTTLYRLRRVSCWSPHCIWHLRIGQQVHASTEASHLRTRMARAKGLRGGVRYVCTSTYDRWGSGRIQGPGCL